MLASIRGAEGDPGALALARSLPQPVDSVIVLGDLAGTSMREHWQSGYEDTKRTLKHQKWLKMPPQGAGIVVHDVHREED